MKILHVLSQCQLTGAEVYAVKLAEEQVNAGHSASFVSDKIHVATKLLIHNLPIHQRDFFHRVSNCFRLRSLIKKENIEILHAHSRAASWVCFFARLGIKNCTLVSSIHGRQFVHLSSKLFSVYGKKLFPVNENLKKHLLQDFRYSSEKVKIQRNGFNTSAITAKNYSSPSLKTKKIAILGRMSGPKGAIIERMIHDIIPYLLERISNLEVTVGGGDITKLSALARASLATLIKKYPGQISAVGILSEKDFFDLIRTSDLVVGSGRIAIESLLLNVPTFGFGEECCIGLIKESNLKQGIESNFGDVAFERGAHPDIHNYEMIRNDLRVNIEGDLHAPNLMEEIEKTYDIQQTSKLILQEYIACSSNAAHTHLQQIGLG